MVLSVGAAVLAQNQNSPTCCAPAVGGDAKDAGAAADHVAVVVGGGEVRQLVEVSLAAASHDENLEPKVAKIRCACASDGALVAAGRTREEFGKRREGGTRRRTGVAGVTSKPAMAPGRYGRFAAAVAVAVEDGAVGEGGVDDAEDEAAADDAEGDVVVEEREIAK